MARVATLHEIDSHWSLDDLQDANEAMDIQEELRELARQEATKK